ncbi:MAG TPA: LD-carboxypeptidase [Phnomibacter sp.]|nr:LD-carboxypeptidase [Phnomibacter sp.]
MAAAITFPPYLKKGNTIGIVCPAGFMPAEKTLQCRKTLEQWGFRVKLGATVGNSFHYFSGTDAERLADMQAMLDDENIHAILCGRGGYGCSRIIDQLDWKKFRKHPKWIIGFSDITVFHNFLYTKQKTASLHAAMANAFNNGGDKKEYVLTLRNALIGKKNTYKIAPHTMNRTGAATGVLLGGNLSILAHQTGTISDINTRGAILFIEDVGEYLYNIDRMLLQLDRAGKLQHLAGLIVGGFSDMKDTTTSFGKTVEEIIQERISNYSFPVCFGFPVSHEEENVALKVGAVYALKVGKTVQLKEV